MKTIRITESNLAAHLHELINMCDDFLHNLDVKRKRSTVEKEEIIRNMIRPGSPTTILIAAGEDGVPLGMAYYNRGTGYSCGGEYIYMNCIYVKPEAQQQGVGLSIITHVENWAKKNGLTLFCAVRDPDNIGSEKLFNKAGFKQNENFWMQKAYK